MAADAMKEQGAPLGGSETPDVDCVVVGAGFGGLHMLYKLRQLGLRALAFEAAPDVGGTWYWNTYPGARCDAESLIYNYSFDPELREEYQSKWPEKYSTQPVILDYAREVANRYGLRNDIRFGTRVIRAAWDETSRHWSVETDKGDEVVARFLVSAVGCLSSAQVPDLPGLESFEGECYHTGDWPKEPVDLQGKRVILIGTGSSGVQVAPVIAETAGHLTVLQRTAQYTIPAGNHPLTPENLEEHVARVKTFFPPRDNPEGDAPLLFEGLNDKKTFDESPEEREAYFEHLWQTAGPFFFLAYKDTMTDLAANDEASEFVRQKIRSIVKDPETAEKLLPRYPIGTKRMVADTRYYETYNRPNVSLEDLRADPIDRVLPEGVRLRSGKVIEADLIVFATGYDAMTGAILRLNIEGVAGAKLADAWAAGPRTYLGLAVHGFPNLFMMTGPQSPSVLSNVIYSIEQHGDWLADLLEHLSDRGVDRVEASLDAQDRWVQYCDDLANRTLYPQTDSWYVGANIPGKPRTFMPFVGGNVLYQRHLDDVRARGYDGFVFSAAGAERPLDHQRSGAAS